MRLGAAYPRHASGNLPCLSLAISPPPRWAAEAEDMEAATGGGEVEVTAWAGEGGRDLIRAGGVDCLVHRSVDSLVYRIIHRGLRFKPPRSAAR